jgi:hypothetical protein
MRTPKASGRQRGVALHDDPLAHRDRRSARLTDGLRPPDVDTLERQAFRGYDALSHYGDDLPRRLPAITAGHEQCARPSRLPLSGGR